MPSFFCLLPIFSIFSLEFPAIFYIAWFSCRHILFDWRWFFSSFAFAFSFLFFSFLSIWFRRPSAMALRFYLYLSFFELLSWSAAFIDILLLSSCFCHYFPYFILSHSSLSSSILFAAADIFSRFYLAFFFFSLMVFFAWCLLSFTSILHYERDFQIRLLHSSFSFSRLSFFDYFIIFLWFRFSLPFSVIAFILFADFSSDISDIWWYWDFAAFDIFFLFDILLAELFAWFIDDASLLDFFIFPSLRYASFSRRRFHDFRSFWYFSSLLFSWFFDVSILLRIIALLALFLSPSHYLRFRFRHDISSLFLLIFLFHMFSFAELLFLIHADFIVESCFLSRPSLDIILLICFLSPFRYFYFRRGSLFSIIFAIIISLPFSRLARWLSMRRFDILRAHIFSLYISFASMSSADFIFFRILFSLLSSRCRFSDVSRLWWFSFMPYCSIFDIFSWFLAIFRRYFSFSAAYSRHFFLLSYYFRAFTFSPHIEFYDFMIFLYLFFSSYRYFLIRFSFWLDFLSISFSIISFDIIFCRFFFASFHFDISSLFLFYFCLFIFAIFFILSLSPSPLSAFFDLLLISSPELSFHIFVISLSFRYISDYLAFSILLFRFFFFKIWFFSFFDAFSIMIRLFYIFHYWWYSSSFHDTPYFSYIAASLLLIFPRFFFLLRFFFFRFL